MLSFAATVYDCFVCVFLVGAYWVHSVIKKPSIRTSTHFLEIALIKHPFGMAWEVNGALLHLFHHLELRLFLPERFSHLGKLPLHIRRLCVIVSHSLQESLSLLRRRCAGFLLRQELSVALLRF